jgi:hypothetical protein
LPDFFWHNIPKRRKIYQIATKLPNGQKHIKKPSYIPNVHRIYRPLQLQGPPKFTQIGNFGSKVNHLATLLITSVIRRRTKASGKADLLQRPKPLPIYLRIFLKMNPVYYYLPAQKVSDNFH